jgi:hypothetical protein
VEIGLPSRGVLLQLNADCKCFMAMGGYLEACAIPGKQGLEDIRAGFAELIELENSLE